MSFYIIDIINFFLIFFLLDYFNGARGNFLAKKLKNSLLTVLVLLLTAAVVCVPFSFFTVAKAALLTAAVIAYIIILGTRLFAEKRMAYTDVEAGKEENFSAKKVMVLVPHNAPAVVPMASAIIACPKPGMRPVFSSTMPALLNVPISVPNVSKRSIKSSVKTTI